MNYKLLALIFPLTLSAHEMDTLSVHKMDEVVVVSTPKEHAALRQQPLSSSAFGAGQLQEKGVTLQVLRGKALIYIYRKPCWASTPSCFRM